MHKRSFNWPLRTCIAVAVASLAVLACSCSPTIGDEQRAAELVQKGFDESFRRAQDVRFYLSDLVEATLATMDQIRTAPDQYPEGALGALESAHAVVDQLSQNTDDIMLSLLNSMGNRAHLVAQIDNGDDELIRQILQQEEDLKTFFWACDNIFATTPTSDKMTPDEVVSWALREFETG